MIDAAIPVDLERPPEHPPTTCVDPLLWQLARAYLEKHARDASGKCGECGVEYPCLGRMLARDGLATALGETVDQTAYWRELVDIRRNDHAGARTVLAAHTPGADGLCAGCRLWWERAVPFPCSQVSWARNVQRAWSDDQPAAVRAAS